MAALLFETVRRANEFDVEAIALIHVISWQKIYAGLMPEDFLQALSIKDREQLWHGLIISDVKVLVIEGDGHILGFASICPYRDCNAKTTEGEISSIYLHPDHWHQGLGTKLCQAALSELKTLGFDEVFVWVLQGNTQARKFYETIGFVETNSIKTEEYADDIVLQEVLYRMSL